MSPTASGSGAAKRALDWLDAGPSTSTRAKRANTRPNVSLAEDTADSAPSGVGNDLNARMSAIERMLATLTQTVRAGPTPSPAHEFDQDDLDYDDDDHVSVSDSLDAGQSDGDPLGRLAADIGATNLRASGQFPQSHATVPTGATVPLPASTVLTDQIVLGRCTLTLLQDTLGREELGDKIYDDLADSLGKSLRHQPNALKVQELVDSIKYPANVPQLKVPLTNDEILNALPKGGRALDAKLFKSSGLLAKCLVPLLHFLSDIHDGALRPLPEYATEIFSSVRLIVANLNYLHQTRKDVYSMLIKEPGLKQLCNWKCPIGEDTILGCDINKKVEEFKKASKMGSTRRGYPRGRSSFRGGRGYSRGRNYFRGFSPRSSPPSGRGKAPASK